MPICQLCSIQLPPGTRFCSRCGASIFPAGAASAQLPATDFRYALDPSLEGISGWLIFVALGLAAAPLLILRTIFRTELPLLLGNHTFVASSIGSLFLIKSFVTLGALLVLNFLFYTKHRNFPRGMIAYYAWMILASFAVHIAYAVASPHETVHLIDRTVFRPLLAASVWVPYLLISKRVKATFVR